MSIIIEWRTILKLKRKKFRTGNIVMFSTFLFFSLFLLNLSWWCYSFKRIHQSKNSMASIAAWNIHRLCIAIKTLSILNPSRWKRKGNKREITLGSTICRGGASEEISRHSYKTSKVSFQVESVMQLISNVVSLTRSHWHNVIRSAMRDESPIPNTKSLFPLLW